MNSGTGRPLVEVAEPTTIPGSRERRDRERQSDCTYINVIYITEF